MQNSTWEASEPAGNELAPGGKAIQQHQLYPDSLVWVYCHANRAIPHLGFRKRRRQHSQSQLRYLHTTVDHVVKHMLKEQLHSQRKLMKLLSCCFMKQPLHLRLLFPCAPHPFPCPSALHSNSGQAANPAESQASPWRPGLALAVLPGELELAVGCKGDSANGTQVAGSGDRDLGVIRGGRGGWCVCERESEQNQRKKHTSRKSIQ